MWAVISRTPRLLTKKSIHNEEKMPSSTDGAHTMMMTGRMKLGPSALAAQMSPSKDSRTPRGAWHSESTEGERRGQDG